MVITCAAADDITAWCMPAAVIAINGNLCGSLYVIGNVLHVMKLCFLLCKTILKKIGGVIAGTKIN
jgi:Kef-type K+ transport system membrane component KefB